MMERRDFLLASAAGLLSDSLSGQDASRAMPPPRRVPARHKIAVVTTAYFYLSHAYHICGRFIHGYLRQGSYHYPDFELAGLYVEQKKANDLSQRIARDHQIRLAATVQDALTLGTGKLAVDGVLLIGEHGDYPYNAKGQKLYPRWELFQKIVEVFKDSGRSVPVFNDKHLSYDHKKGREMVQLSRTMGFPMLAGSSLPVTWRRPELEIPLGSTIREALVVSRGELEIMGIHAIEALQCMVERRNPGQQGVASIECLEGDAVWKAGAAGRWSYELLDHALGRSPSRNVGKAQENCQQFAIPASWGVRARGPRAFLIEYRDGLKATVLQLDGHVADETFAAFIGKKKKPVSTLFWLPPPPGAAFLEALARHIESFLETGTQPYPVERTLLTGGILDYALESRLRQRTVLTPDLDISYQAPKDSGFMKGDYVIPAG